MSAGVGNASLLWFMQNQGPSLESRDAYRTILESGYLAEAQGRVLKAILDAPEGLSNNEICRVTGMRINVVTARVHELRRELHANGAPLVVRGGARVDEHTGKMNAVWKVSR